MKPTNNELKAIRIAERYYINKNKGSMKLFSYLKFKLKWHKVSKEKTLAQLWHQYGCKSSTNVH